MGHPGEGPYGPGDGGRGGDDAPRWQSGAPGQGQPGGYQPTRPFERGPEPGDSGSDGRYSLGYTVPGQQQGYPPPGPGYPAGGPTGPGAPGDGGGGGGGRTPLLIAIGVVAVVLVLAIGTVAYFLGRGSSSTQTAAEASPTTSAPSTSTTQPALPSMTLPSELPSFTLPPIPGLGGASSANGAGAQYTVEITGNGSAQIIAVGIPEMNTLGPQTLPWKKQFVSDSFVVSVTAVGFDGPATCTITKNGAVVVRNSSTGGMVMCNGS